MSRRAVYQALVSDSVLNSLGINGSNVFSNYSKDTVPIPRSPFVILRWQERPVRFASVLGPQIVTLWAHFPQEDTTDFSNLDAVLRRSVLVLQALEDVDGGDGDWLTCVRFTGESGDFNDPGYNTITKNAGFEVLYRPSA